MRVVAPVGVSTTTFPYQVNLGLMMTGRHQSAVRLRLRITFTIAGQTFQDQVDFSGFPQGLTGGSS